MQAKNLKDEQIKTVQIQTGSGRSVSFAILCPQTTVPLI